MSQAAKQSQSKKHQQSVQQAHLKPREKLLQLGSTSLSDAELLAIFLRTGSKDLPVMELAQQLLDRLGLKGLFDLAYQQLSEFKGLGVAKYAQLQAILELSRRFLLANVAKGESIQSPEAMQNYLIGAIGSHLDEVFGVAFLDNRNCLICFEVLFTGSINQATVHPRKIIRKALKYNAAGVILAHNHPSNDLNPSDSDIELTKTLKYILKIIDVRLLDHFIVGKTACQSMASQQLL